MLKNVQRRVCDLVSRSDRSVFVPSGENLDKRLVHWHNNLPNIMPYYAVKSLPDHSLIDALAGTHGVKVGFDIASLGELNLVCGLSFDIIHTNPCRTPEEIYETTNRGVKTYVIDSLHELVKLNKYKSSLSSGVGAMVRIKGKECFSKTRFNSKFGVGISSSSSSTLEEIYRHWPTNIEPLGFAFHVGSRCSNANAYAETIENVVGAHIPLARKYGLDPKIIDIGGGFSCEKDVTNLAKVLKTIDIPAGIRMIAEPGRYFSSNYMKLYTRIKSVRLMDDGVYIITINDSVSGSFNGIYFDHLKPAPIFLDPDGNETIKETSTGYNVRIVGQTCDSLDVICENLVLNEIPTESHVIKWENMGSYTLASSAGKFNGFTDAYVLK